jgi:hypothetical protein
MTGCCARRSAAAHSPNAIAATATSVHARPASTRAGDGVQPRQETHRREQPDRQRDDPGHVERAARLRRAARQRGARERDHDQRERNVADENPAPRGERRDRAADERTDDGGDAPRRRHQAQRGTAPLERDAIGDRRRRDREDPARTRGLNRAREQKDGVRRRGDREDAAGGEHADAHDVDRSPPVCVGELRRHRDGDDVRQQIQREDPREVARPDAERGAERGQRRGEHAQIERAREHPQAQGEQQRQRAAVDAMAADDGVVEGSGMPLPRGHGSLSRRAG